MRCTVLMLLWLVVFCNDLKAVAQNSFSTFTATLGVTPTMDMSTPIGSFINTVPIPTVVMPSSAIVVSSPDIDTAVPLTPTGAIVMTSLVPMDTGMPVFVVTIATVAPSSVGVVDTSPTIMMTTTVAMTSSSIMPTTTVTVITTSNPAPIPEGDSGSTGFSTGATIGIAAGGGTALAFVVILVIVICCCCRHRKRRQQETYLMTSPTIQARPQDYIVRQSSLRGSRRSNISFTGSMRSLRDSLRRAKVKGKPEDTKLIITPL